MHIRAIMLIFCTSLMQAHIDLVILIERPDSIEKELAQSQGGALTMQLDQSIRDHMITLVSGNLIHALQQASASNNYLKGSSAALRDPTQWSLWRLGSHFVALVPMHAEQRVDTAQLKRTTLQQTLLCDNVPVAIDEITHFLQAQHHATRIYISGHGISSKNPDGPVIAQCTLSEYKHLLKTLSSSGCEFLCLMSCYAGGLTMMQAHEDCYPFTIVIPALADAVSVISDHLNFAAFFEHLESYFKNHDPHALKTAMNHIVGPHIYNMASIKEVQSDEFKPLDIHDDIIIVTQNSAPITCSHQRAIALCSPNIPATITITSSQPPLIVSMLPGNAEHTLTHIDALLCTFHDFFSSFLQVHTDHPKKFFIKKLTLATIKLYNVFIEPSTIKELCSDCTTSILNVSFTMNNRHYSTDISKDTLALAQLELSL